MRKGLLVKREYAYDELRKHANSASCVMVIAQFTAAYSTPQSHH